MSMFKGLGSGLGSGWGGGFLPDPTAYKSRINTAFINRSIEEYEKILRDGKEKRDAMNVVDENNTNDHDSKMDGMQFVDIEKYTAIDGQCVQRDDVKLLGKIGGG